MNLATVMFYGLAFYAAVGICTAAAFVTFGVTRILGAPISMTAGARVLIFPGTAALWPYVLLRWFKSGQRP